ncbi:MAG: serine/threonine-protein kinase [Burkholderiales bacterium]
MATNRLGRYEILGELGRGAMGVVYRARDPIIDRVVALKTINLALTGAALASFEERFFQEARSAGRLNHPNIVTIYDAGKADGVAYIAMEFLEGTPLREILDEHPPLSIPRILETVAQVARGLAYAHENGVVHRDIKPANVIVLRNRRPKITDFGIARLGEADGVGSERAGSPKYMSPEQIRGDVTLDGRSDVFSLGTVLYEMLTGKAPFAGETVTDIMQSVLEYTPPVPSVVDGHVPPELDGVVMRMLAKRPDDRYPSARSLFRELRRVDENFTARGEHAPPEPETHVEPDALLPPTPRTPVGPGDKTLVIGTAPARRATWQRAAALGAIAAVIAVIAIIPLKLQYNDANATRDAAAGSSPAVAAAPAPEQRAAEPVAPAPEPPAAAPAPPPPPKKAAAPRPARKAAPEPPPVVVAPPPPPPPVVVAAAPPAPPPPQTATLLLTVSPWGEVYVDGKRRGLASPVATIEVPPGRHRVEIRNASQPSYLANVTVQAGDTQQITHRFD